MRRLFVLPLGLALALGGCSRDDAAAPPPAPPAVVAPPAPTVAPPAPTVAPPRPAVLTRVTIKALGMYCEESCPQKVRYALAEQTAIYELGFDLSNESIFVSYDAALGPAKQVTRPMLTAIKETAGFDPWLARESWPEDATVQVVRR